MTEQMNDNEWNDWTEEIRTYMETAAQHAESYDGSEKSFNRRLTRVQNALEDGDDDASLRESSKKTILEWGRPLPYWPKQRGKGTSFSQWANDMVTFMTQQWSECWTAFYQAAEERGIEHHLMTRASNKEQTDGAPYGTLENFLKARNASTKASYKSDFRNGLWGSFNTDKEAPQPEGTIAELAVAPLIRPFTPKEENNEGDAE